MTSDQHGRSIITLAKAGIKIWGCQRTCRLCEKSCVDVKITWFLIAKHIASLTESSKAFGNFEGQSDESSPTLVDSINMARSTCVLRVTLSAPDRQKRSTLHTGGYRRMAKRSKNEPPSSRSSTRVEAMPEKDFDVRVTYCWLLSSVVSRPCIQASELRGVVYLVQSHVLSTRTMLGLLHLLSLWSARICTPKYTCLGRETSEGSESQNLHEGI